jgi:DNA-binding SARP family transcriptional activator
MNGDREQRQPVLSFLAAIGCVLLLGALWVLKPPLPRVSSFTGALSETTFEQLIFFIGWILLSAATLALLYEAVRRITDAPSRRTLREVQRLEQAITPSGTEPAGAPASERRYRPPLVMTVRAPARTTDGQGAVAAQAQATDVSRSSPGDGARGGARLRIQLLGPFSIEGIDLPTGLRSTCKQLIAYLALHPHGAARDELIEALWPEQDPRRGRQRLWQAISDARNLLGDALVAEDGHYTIDRHDVTVDVEQLEELIAQADAADAPADQLPPLEDAVGLFAGEPLTGWDQPWADPDVRRLRSIHAELLARAGHARLVTGDAHGALQAAEAGLKLDNLNEALWRLAMQAESRLGLRDSINQRYQRLRHQLDEQLGIEPETATRALYHELLGQR